MDTPDVEVWGGDQETHYLFSTRPGVRVDVTDSGCVVDTTVVGIGSRGVVTTVVDASVVVFSSVVVDGTPHVVSRVVPDSSVRG